MARATSRGRGAIPCIEFVVEAERCPVCGGAPSVYKTRSRKVVTLAAGPFQATETLMQCHSDPTHPVMGSNTLARVVKPRQRYGYDLIVHAGRARYLENKQRGEIQAELYRQRGIELSTGSLSYLCDRFLTHLEALHLARAPQLRSALGEGYPLHIDATCEHGKGVVREDPLALVLWILEGDGTKDLLYPFALVHPEFFQRCQQALQRAPCWVQGPRTLPERRTIEHLTTLVRRFDKDDRFTTAVTRLEQGWQAFCELRDVLQLSNAELPRADVRAHQRELAPLEARRMREIKAALRDYRSELGERIASSQRAGALSTSPSAVIVKYLDRYGERLFGHPVRRDEEGTIVAIVERTNNVPEHFFGHEKQHLRRRLGRANLGRDLEDQPAQAALAANLRHPDYVRVLCGSLDHLPMAFADLDEQALAQATPLSRSNRDSKLQHRIRALLKSEKTVVSETDS